MLTIGQLAPDFSAAALLPSGEIQENFILSSYTKNHRTLLVFYPLDFTFVCPSELIALQNRLHSFQERGAKVLAISIDSVHAHLAFTGTSITNGGLGRVDYPLISDLSQDICRMYGVQHSQDSVALRANILLDENRIVRYFSVQDLFIGRNFDEPLRVIDALIHHQRYGDVCPAQWTADKPAMQASAEGVRRYLNQHLEDLN